jgi:hypothetical protein
VDDANEPRSGLARVALAAIRIVNGSAALVAPRGAPRRAAWRLLSEPEGPDAVSGSVYRTTAGRRTYDGMCAAADRAWGWDNLPVPLGLRPAARDRSPGWPQGHRTGRSRAA